MRGPDESRYEIIDGVHFLHHLLSLTGKHTTQPFADGSAACVFNGEIYNYASMGDYATDGECILDAWRDAGTSFTDQLDGEYAIVIVSGQRIIVATDPFATKPLWIGFEDGNWSVASYASDIPWASTKVPGNVVREYRPDGRLVAERQTVEWSLAQTENDTHGWIEAFESAVRKRAHPAAFLGLSSGYDSGAIACEMLRQGHDFTAYSISNGENMAVLHDRLQLLPSSVAFSLSGEEYDHWRKSMQEAEPFQYRDRFKNYSYQEDKATVGLAAICHRANQKRQRVYLSGQGADEILSDYGFAGRKIYNHSEFGGLFPEKQRLWHSFADGTQIQYLNKEEYTAGHFGIEARYPFLDRQVVQAFLRLKPAIKNRHYKSPLHDYLMQQGFPFDCGKKLGFNPNK